MGFIFIAAVYVILTTWIMGIIIAFRKVTTCMVGMMSAMTLGMTFGLGIGSLLTIWLPGQFFQSSIIAMLLGGGVGVIAGAPINFMSVLDGLLSGVMGGMMGTMLIVMIPAPYTGLTIKLLSVLFFGSLFILFLILREELVSQDKSGASRFYLKPGLMFIIIVVSSALIMPLTVTH